MFCSEVCSKLNYELMNRAYGRCLPSSGTAQRQHRLQVFLRAYLISELRLDRMKSSDMRTTGESMQVLAVVACFKGCRVSWQVYKGRCLYHVQSEQEAKRHRLSRELFRALM